MLEKFKKHLKDNFPDLESTKFYVAASAGIDSMVLVHLLQKCNFYFGILHCNFKLRGIESDGDSKFIQDYGDKFTIPYSIGTFQTKEYAKDEKLSIQMAARELRYDWFEEQCDEKEIDFILTAHHLDDSLETFIINLSRGTGIDGLLGIPEENDYIIRPLLPFSRQEIAKYAYENEIVWREDSSNESDVYLRNKIRQLVVPSLKELNDNFLNSFQKTISNLSHTKSLVTDAVEFFREKIVDYRKNGLFINIEELLKFNNYKYYLYEILKEYYFTSWSDIFDLIFAETGKKIESPMYTLLKNRDYLILEFKTELLEDEVFFIEKNDVTVNFPLNISISKVPDISANDSNSIFVDEDLLDFPLTIRKKEKGDLFFPFGMKGSKKLSKFFKDEKFSQFDKESAWILCSNDKIVWVINHRMDDRFKVTSKTKSILKFTTTS